MCGTNYRFWAILIIVVILLMPFVTPLPVYATTQSRACASNGSLTDGSYVGGASNYTNMNSDDNDTSYLRLEAGGHYYSWSMQNFTESYQTISKVSVTIKGSGSSYNVIAKPFVRIGATNYVEGGSYFYAGVYSTYTYDYITNPATSANWTASDINNAQWGINQTSAATFGEYTYFYITVDYISPSIPTMTTEAANPIGVTTATLNGTISNTGGENPTIRGFVWGTTSNATMPSSTQVPPAGYTTNSSEGGSFSTGSFTYPATGLTANTYYYYRSYAMNSMGYGYGNEVSFKTIGIPSGSTLSATGVASTEATLQGSVANDNGQACDVRFGYDNVTHAAVADYAFHTTWQNDTYSTGSFPFAFIDSLNPSNTYYFRIQIENDAGIYEGAELTFTTASGVFAPTNFTAVTTADTVYLAWTKGIGTSYTLIRCSSGTYPNTTAEGTYVFLGTTASCSLANLLPGTTYYFSAWGKTGLVYSSTYASLLTTTLAANIPISQNNTVIANASWLQTPDATNVSNLPFFPALVQLVSDTYKQPIGYLWYFLWIMAGVAFGVLTFKVSGDKLFVSFGLEALWFGLGAVVGLVMLWILAAFCLVGLGISWFGDRR